MEHPHQIQFRECRVPINKAGEAVHVGRGWQEGPAARLPVKTNVGGLGEGTPPSEIRSRGPLGSSLGHGSVPAWALQEVYSGILES